MSSWRPERSLAGSNRQQAPVLLTETWRRSAVLPPYRPLTRRSLLRLARSSRRCRPRHSRRPEDGTRGRQLRRVGACRARAAATGADGDRERISRQDCTVGNSSNTWQCLCTRSHCNPWTPCDWPIDRTAVSTRRHATAL